jgi:hypothetical protein
MAPSLSTTYSLQFRWKSQMQKVEEVKVLEFSLQVFPLFWKKKRNEKRWRLRFGVYQRKKFE